MRDEDEQAQRTATSRALAAASVSDWGDWGLGGQPNEMGAHWDQRSPLKAQGRFRFRPAPTKGLTYINLFSSSASRTYRPTLDVESHPLNVSLPPPFHPTLDDAAGVEVGKVHAVAGDADLLCAPAARSSSSCRAAAAAAASAGRCRGFAHELGFLAYAYGPRCS